MNVKKLDINELDLAANLYDEADEGGIYVPLGKDGFTKKFFNRSDVETTVFVAEDDHKRLLGMIICDYKMEYLRGENFENTPGYISFIKVSYSERGRSIGSLLIDKALDYFKSIGKTKVSVTYRNPINLEWHVPADESIRHNNAPGVVVDSPAFKLFIKKGFESVRIEDGLFLSLSSFFLNEKYNQKKNILKKSGIETGLYNPEIHYGFDELFDALHGEVWRKTINDNNSLSQPLPVLVASDNGKIVGFAGPITKESNGRGWFNGIATHPDYERRGIAFVLFSRLLYEFKEIGAKFSTIFTDEENPALILYKSVGFRIGARFSVMERNI